jgi:hypothetical protein
MDRRALSIIIGLLTARGQKGGYANCAAIIEWWSRGPGASSAGIWWLNFAASDTSTFALWM